MDFGTFNSLIEFLNMIYTLNLISTFSEVVKLLKILITTPMTTAESERCFSSLKRIKTFLESTMKNDRLTGLAMTSIENQMITETKDFNKKKIINHFAQIKT